jgi:FkbM family methyltransferase
MAKFIRKFKLLLAGIRTYRNWLTWLLFKLRLLAGGRERVIALRNGLRFAARFDLNEPGTIDDVMMRNEYFTERNKLRNGATVVDVGANIGAFSIVAAMRAKGVKVFSFEPHPDTFARLEKNVGLNALGSAVTPLNFAIAERKGTLKLFVHPTISGANTVAPYRAHLDFVEAGDSIPVSAITLEDAFRECKVETCDFLKLDCEGAEFGIIASVPDSVLRKVRHIAMEYHRDPAPLKARLARAGFAVTVKPTDENSGFLFADREHVTSNS